MRFGPLISNACSANPGGRTVPLENLHVTLYFAGECGPVQAEQLREALCEAYRADAGGTDPRFPMRLRASEPGSFRSGRERVLWLRVEPSDGIARFRTMLLDALERRGWPPPRRRELVPHITIARNVPAGSGIGGETGSPAPALRPADCPFTAVGPSLMESVLQEGRTRYVARCRPAVGPEWIKGGAT